MSLALFALSPRALANTYVFESSKEFATGTTRILNKEAKSQLLAGGAVSEVFAGDGQMNKKPLEKSNLTLKTGPESFYISGRDFTRIYDFKKRRMFVLNNMDKTYSCESLYGILAFRLAELANRLVLNQVLSGVALKDKGLFDKFFSETMMSMQLVGKGSAYKLEKAVLNGEAVYKYAGKTVASVKLAGPLSAESRRQLSLYLIWETPLHPVIRQDILKSGKAFQLLKSSLENPPVYNQKLALSLLKTESSEYKISIDQGFKELASASDPLSEVRTRIKELGGLVPADLKARTIAYAEAAREKKNYLDALLALTEYGLQTGENLTDELRNMKSELEADQDCQLFMAALKAPQSEEEANLALGSLDMIERNKHEKSYLLDIFRANLIIDLQRNGSAEIKTAGQADPEKSFLAVLKVNPFITGVYSDLGSYYESKYMQRYAWSCYDLARQFYPQHAMMLEVNEKEKKLAETCPEFFQGDKL